MPTTEFDDAAREAWDKEELRRRKHARAHERELRQKFLEGRERATEHLDEFVRESGLDELVPKGVVAEWFVYDWDLLVVPDHMGITSSQQQWLVVHPKHSSVWFRVSRRKGGITYANPDEWRYAVSIVEGGVSNNQAGNSSNWKVKVGHVACVEDIGRYLADRDAERSHK